MKRSSVKKKNSQRSRNDFKVFQGWAERGWINILRQREHKFCNSHYKANYFSHGSAGQRWKQIFHRFKSILLWLALPFLNFKPLRVYLFGILEGKSIESLLNRSWEMDRPCMIPPSSFNLEKKYELLIKTLPKGSVL